MTLRPYQQKVSDQIDEAFARGRKAVAALVPTGGGKTHIISHQTKKANCLTVDIAHRQELVFQISMALARDGIFHRILAPDAVSNYIRSRHHGLLGRAFIDPQAPHTVASVDTILSRMDDLGNWPKQVSLAQTDEAHHCLIDNKWGKGLSLFINARKIGWSATWHRADRKSLKFGAGGLFEELIIGPSVSDLMGAGFLARYRIYGPPPSIDVSGVSVTPSGDFSGAQLRREAHSVRSTIVGDMVNHYGKLAPGRVGIAFNVDVELAKETAERFNNANGSVIAVWMSSRETDDRTRQGNIEALARGDLKLICNVDLLGEGVDVPRVEVILDGAPTMSLSRYLQRFGRLLRPFPGKFEGIYCDLVGNVLRHGLPDQDRTWSLEVPEKRKKLPNDESALKACPECFHVFEVFKPRCPHCGWKPVPREGGARRPEEVDGDLLEYSVELLDSLRAKAAEIAGPVPRNVNQHVADAWDQRARVQEQLRASMDRWAGVQVEKGMEISTVYRLFFHRFGIDVATAATLGRQQAATLDGKVWEDINNGCSRPKYAGGVPAVEVERDDADKQSVKGVINSRFDKSTQRWKCVPKISGKNKPYYFKTKEKCQVACDWCNANPGQYLPDELKETNLIWISGTINPRFDKSAQMWRCIPTINGKRKQYLFKTKEKCQIACEWCNNNPDQHLPEEYRDR